MSEAQESGGLSRRRFLQTSAAGAAVAALPAGASAQDGNTTDSDGGDTGTTYQPPDQFLGDASNAIGVDRMLISALKYDESERTPDGITEATFKVLSRDYATGDYYDDPTDLDEAAGNGILQLDKMDTSDHHVLLNMFNQIQLARNQAFFEGLSAFLENVEAGNDQSTTVSATKTAGFKHYVDVQTNLAAFWKEQLNQLKAYRAYLQESFDWGSISNDIGDVLTANLTKEGSGWSHRNVGPWSFPTGTVELVDGSTIETPELGIAAEGTHTSGGSWGSGDVVYGLSGFRVDSDMSIGVIGGIPLVSLPDGSVTNGILGYDPNDPTTKQGVQDLVSGGTYDDVGAAMEQRLDSSLSRLNMYLVLWDWIEQEAQLVQNNLEQVATNTYGQLQTGDLTISEFVQANPAFAASEYATDYESTGHYTYAAALMASVGAAYDFEHEMRVQLSDGTTMSGTMLVSNDDFAVSVGETVNPSNFEGEVYFAYSGDSAERTLSTEEYQENVDGGVITLTTTPVEGSRYTLKTIESEFLHLSAEDWSPVDETAATDPEQTTNWTYDASDELDDPITQIESVTNHYPDGTGAGMVRIENPFKILEAYNTETGEEVDDVTGEQGTDLSDTETQFTQEDIEAFRDMVDAVNEESDPPGGGGGGGLGLDLGGDWLPDEIMGFPTELVLLTGGAILIYGAVTN